MTDDQQDAGQPRSSDEIFLDALEQPVHARKAFLARACGGNVELRNEVEDLLAVATRHPELLHPPEIGLIPAQFGRYEIIRECGRGGMGIVFEAVDQTLLRRIALKVLPRHLSGEQHNRERFKREARTLASLNDPGIATLFSLEESEGHHFLTMEFIDGVTLADILADRRMTLEETVSIGIQITAALERAHARGVCHCDLKPANIMIGDDGRVTLLDFGIARAFDQHSSKVNKPEFTSAPSQAMTGFLGTPGYMAPEQVAGESVDERCDLWALGVILHECLTGDQVDGRAGVDDETTFTPLPTGTPHSLVRLVSSCLDVDRNRRLASATEARQVLQRHRRRHPSRKLIGGGTLAAIFGIVLAAWMLSTGSPGPLVRLDTSVPNVVIGRTGDGEEIWSRRFPSAIRHSGIVTDTSRAGEGGVAGQSVGCYVTVTYGGSRMIQHGLDPGTGNVIWSLEPSWTPPINMNGPAMYRWTRPHPWPESREPVLLNAIRDGLWYGFALEAVDLTGSVLGVYHHPGPLAVANLPPDPGRPVDELILYGVNSTARFDRRLVPFDSNAHPGSVVMLGLPDISGQAYPWSEVGPGRDWPGMARASEKIYLVIPLISPEYDAEVVMLFANDDAEAGKGYTAQTLDGRMVFLDDRLYPQRCALAKGGTALELAKRGEFIDLPFLYLRGGTEEWVQVEITD